jgi:hypothetical protein
MLCLAQSTSSCVGTTWVMRVLWITRVYSSLWVWELKLETKPRLKFFISLVGRYSTTGGDQIYTVTTLTDEEVTSTRHLYAWRRGSWDDHPPTRSEEWTLMKLCFVLGWMKTSLRRVMWFYEVTLRHIELIQTYALFFYGIVQDICLSHYRQLHTFKQKNTHSTSLCNLYFTGERFREVLHSMLCKIPALTYRTFGLKDILSAPN